MSATVLRFASFVAIAIAAAGLWVAVFRSSGGTVAATPAIPSFSSQSIFAAATGRGHRLSVSGVVQHGDCKGCDVHVGSGGLVRAEVPYGRGRRTAYALLDLGNRAAHGPVLVHDVIGFGAGEAPASRVRLLRVLDSSDRVIFELVAGPDRRLYLTSPPGGLRATSLMLATGAVVPNDGISGVAVDVALKANGWLLVSVNGVRTAAVRRLVGARTGAPRFLAAGVIGYRAPRSAGAITATHAQVSVSTPSAPAAKAAQPVPPAATAAQHVPPAATAAQPLPAAQPVDSGPPLSSLSPPTISGASVVGGTLIAAPGTWSDPTATFTYAWDRCDANGSCTAIDGGRAQSKTYDLVPPDRHSFVRVRVTAHVGDASASRASAAVGPIASAAPMPLGAPSISGSAVVGATLTADPGSWSDRDATLTFVWQRCGESGICSTIDGATGATHEVTADDLGSSLQVEVTASNSGGARTAASAPTDVVVPAAPSVVTAPTISGDAIVGSILSAHQGTWSDPTATFTYAWLRCHGNGGGSCTTIEGAGDPRYLLTGDDVGFRIEVTVTAANGGGTGSAGSNLLGPVVPQAPPAVVTPASVNGDATVGSTLTAAPGTWSDPRATFTYAWLRCNASSACTTIAGAGGTKYTLTTDDLGFSIGVEVTAAGVGGTGTADSSLLGPVVLQAAPAVVTPPSLSGDAIVGSILTADPGTWSDPTATFTYGWLRCHGKASDSCTSIEGAHGATYTLNSEDLYFLMRVEVTAANAGGAVTAQSTPTAPVEPAAPAPSTAEVIPSGSP